MRVAYVKSGDVVAAMGRLSMAGSGPADDGGPDAFLGDLLRTMSGDDLLLLGIAPIALRDRETERDGVRAVTLAARRRWRVPRNLLRTFREITRFRPARVICGKCGPPLWTSWLAARAVRADFFHSRHNWHEESGILGRLGAALDGWVVRRAQGVLCHGPCLRERLERSGVPTGRTFAFDSGNSVLAELAEGAAGAVLPQGGGAPTVLFVGRMVRSKGIFELLDACAALFPELPGLRLVYAGTGVDLDALREQVVRRRLATRVQCLGRVSHGGVGGLMRASLVVVTPSRRSFPEGRCMVAMEALAVGTPVIAPDCGPFPYLVRDGFNGLLYTPDSVSALGACLRRVLSEEDLRATLAAGARESGARLLRPEVTFSQALGRALAAADG